MVGPTVGDTHTTERTVSQSTVREFAELVGDERPRHTDVDDRDRLMIPELLALSMLAEVASDLDLRSRDLRVQFLRPVYSGDHLRCTWRIERVVERPGGWDVTGSVSLERLGGPDGDGGRGETTDPETVLEATVSGRIPH